MHATVDAHFSDRLLRGEQDAYRDLVCAHQGAMKAVAYGIVGRQDAEIEDGCVLFIDGRCYAPLVISHEDSPEALLSESELYARINIALG